MTELAPMRLSGKEGKSFEKLIIGHRPFDRWLTTKVFAMEIEQVNAIGGLSCVLGAP
jgi:hypothetical protein